MKWCLYNGVKCPALPDIPSVYPYVLITGGGNLSVVRAGKSPAFIKNIYGTENVCYEGGSIWYAYDSTNERWSEAKDATTEYVTTPAALIWSNHDIMNTDGSVYLAASDPILVADSYASYVHIGTWRKGTFYKRIQGQWVKHQAYRRVNGAWVTVKE